MRKNTSKKNNILESWTQNADSWIKAIEQEKIPSRQLITNQAIIDAVLAVGPRRVLDAGCGEGWLSRTLQACGLEADGFDGVPALVENAQQLGTGRYFVFSYEDIRRGKAELPRDYDMIVFNYSLFEKEAVAPLLTVLKKHLIPAGHLVIQTISDQNPLFASRKPDGWMVEDWSSFDRQKMAPFPWYYRSAEEWSGLFAETQFKLIKKQEIIHPLNGQYFSVIYTLSNQTG